MALDVTPGEILTRTRDGVRDQYLDDYALRVPDADVGPGTQPYVDASVLADSLVVVLNDAQVIGRGTSLRTSAGPWLRNIGEPMGVDPRPAVGATGYVTIVASTGGGTIQYGTEVVEPKSGLRFKTISATGLYTNGAEVAIAGVDVGPSTNFAADTVMQFTAPPPGIGLTCVVVEQNDGSGLSGGREADDDEQYRLQIQEKLANPPASGNAAEYQRQIEYTQGHGVAVERAFIYPAVLGPGTIAWTFTVRASIAGGSRLPNGAELAAVYAYVVGLEPADDSAFDCTITAQLVTVALRMEWTTGAAGWVDVSPWPLYVTGDKVLVDGAVSPTATMFRLTTGTSTTTPQVGQTIAFFDAAGLSPAVAVAVGVFRRKRIGAVAVVVAGKSWDITCDTSNGASDLSYAPSIGQAPSPWSSSLDAITPAVQAYFAGLGPGEQLATLPDPGARGRRWPPSPQSWSSVINDRLLAPLFQIGAVSSPTRLEPPNPTTTTVGTAGVLSYLLTLGDLCVFAPDP